MASLNFVLCTLVILLTLACTKSNELNIEISKYPDGKDFAFTITDDPDYGILVQKPIIYDLLDSLNLKTTIPIWVLENKHGSGEDGSLTNTRGITTNNIEYFNYILSLKHKGFEIALHTVSAGNDKREDTIEGYEIFKEKFGEYPKVNINHANNLENIYWGEDRFSNILLKFLYTIFKKNKFYGEDKESDYFWGDICEKRTKYVRSWAVDNINSLALNKSMPYHLTDKPYVQYWFGCSDGSDADKFINLASFENINELVKQRGTSIVYTHFAYGFIDENNKINEKVVEELVYISKLNGWFVPVSTILDRFLLIRNVEVLKKDNIIFLFNHNNEKIKGFTILTKHKKIYLHNEKRYIFLNDDGEIILGDFEPYAVIKIALDNSSSSRVIPKKIEEIKMFWNWLLGRFD